MIAFPPGFISNLCRGSQTRAQWWLNVCQRQRVTVLLSTHAVDEAILFSDRVYVMTACPGKLKMEIEVDN